MDSDLIIVDDDQILLVILKKMFDKVSPELKVLTFSNGNDALLHLKNFPFEKTPSLLVDIYLNDMDGWEFLEEIDHDERFFSKVFLITSSVGSQDSINSQRYKSVGGFFEKPITFDKIKAISNLIED
jgi:response regulator of citrate/malate metabolism